ncbi:MAG: hypothetical protein K6F07_04010 [Bacilli bacterium]|nr:hypothetical protein [Bacilli bacterium]
MKKLLKGVFTLALVLSLGACSKSAKKEEEQKFDETILKDDTVGGYALLGPNALYVGEQQLADWGAYDGSVGTMEATSVAKVAEFDKELAKTLASKKLKALYMIKDIHVGDKALAGWNTTYLNDAGEEAQADGVYCLKSGTWVVDEDTQKNVVDTWVPSKESGKVESLTPKSYWITSNFQEEKDEHGFDWNTNPVVKTGAGVYTMVVAKYAEKVNDAGFGIGVHLQEAKPEFVPASFDHYHLTGSMNSWNNVAADTDSATYHFTKKADGTQELTYTFAADDLFRFTSVLTDGSGSWDGVGYSHLSGAPATWTAAEGTDNNIKITAAGTFKVVVNAAGTSVTVTEVA